MRPIKPIATPSEWMAGSVVAAIAVVTALVVLLTCAMPAQAAGQVGTGTPGSCTSKALEDAVNAGSGAITFNCGVAPYTIVITSPGGISINGGLQYTIEGANKISLSGGDTQRVFVVASGAALTLSNLSIVHGRDLFDDGGAIRNDGTLAANHVTFDHNVAGDSFSGGAILSFGPLSIRESTFSNNEAGNGGALFPRFGSALTVISNTSFYSNVSHNATNGWGGAILIWDGASVSVSGGDFRDNVARADGGAVYVFSGGGISSLTISGTHFTNNYGTVPPSLGGAIYSNGTLSITHALFDSNHGGNGGAIYIAGQRTRIVSSTFARNWASFGGALQSLSDLYIDRSVFAANGFKPDGSLAAINGGGIAINGGSAELSNTTLNGNGASIGGGLFQFYGGTTLLNVTLSGNTAQRGGGIDQTYGSIYAIALTVIRNTATDLGYAGGLDIYNALTSFSLFNSIVGENANGNCTFFLGPNNYNLATDYTCNFGFGYDHVAIQLGPLVNNGGFAPTHLPFANSPAVDFGSPAYCLATDERGVTRPQGPHCDIGAVERIPGELGPALFLPLLRR